MILRKVLPVLLLLSTAVAAAPVEIPLLQGVRGKVVVVDFWASWCQPCRQSFPWMSDLQKRLGPSGLVVIAVNVDQDRQLAERFLEATPAAFRIEYDASGALATRFDVAAMPSSFLIDRKGEIRESHKGYRDAQRVEREQSILKLLKE
jgi:cytochrome c biogenesis protein CcmG, thiol:disulfide interchange protein DsbE